MSQLRSRWILVLLVVLAIVGAVRASQSREVGGDFLRYHRAGRLVATDRADRIYDPAGLAEQFVYVEERNEVRAGAGAAGADAGTARPYLEEEFKYLPATAVLLAPLGALHPRTAWVVWGAWNGVLIGLTIAAAWSMASRGTSTWWVLLPAVVLARAANDNQNLGQLNPSAIAPATIALWALDRGRDRLAGGLAAAGAVVKFVPLGLALWFAMKRRWLAAGITVAGFLALAWGVPAVVLGSDRAADLNAEYLARRVSVYTEAAPPDVPGHSVKSFVYRAFGSVPYQTAAAGAPVSWDLGVVEAAPTTLRVVVFSVVVALGLAVLAMTWGPLRSGGDVRGPAEAGLFVCWLLLASPESRAPHFLYLAVPLAALTCGLVRAWRERWPSREAATILAVVGAFLVNSESRTLLGRDLAEGFAALCGLGWATLAIGAALTLLLRGQRGSAREAEAVATTV